MYKFTLLSFLFIILNASICFGQWSFSAGPGVTLYAGDVAEVIGDVNLAFNMEIWYEINDKFTIKSGSSIYKISADDYIPERNRSFRAKSYESYVQLMYSWKKPHFNYYRENSSLTPFIYFGLGLTKVDPEGKAGSSNGYYNLVKAKPEVTDISQISLIIPFGGGFKVDIKPHFALVIDSGIRIATSDLLDGVSSREININQLSENAISYYSNINNKNIDPKGGNPSIPDFYSLTTVKLLYVPMHPTRQSKYRKKHSYPKYSRFTSKHRRR